MGTDHDRQPDDRQFTERILSAEEIAEIEQREAEDAASFGMDGAASQSDLSVEFTRKNSNKMVMVWVSVAAIAVVLVTCIAAGLIGYSIMSQKPEPLPDNVAKKKQLLPLKEIKAKIKNIDRDQRTIKLLVRDGVYETFRITPETEFLDFAGQRLPQGLDAPELRAEDFALIMATEDRQGLQYLKLTR